MDIIQKHQHLLWAIADFKWSVAKWKTVLWSDLLRLFLEFSSLKSPFDSQFKSLHL